MEATLVIADLVPLVDIDLLVAVEGIARGRFRTHLEVIILSVIGWLTEADDRIELLCSRMEVVNPRFALQSCRCASLLNRATVLGD